jgi:hypothetical protein
MKFTMKQNYALLFGSGLVTILLFASCQSGREPLPAGPVTGTMVSQPAFGQTTPLPLATTSVITEVETALSLADLDPTPSVTAISDTKMPQTPTIVAATLTPLPTLEGEQLEAAIAELLANPMNCDVPCWWGFIPGITNIAEIRHAISPFGFDISEYYDEEGNLYTRLGIGYVAERNDFEIRIGFWFSDSILAGVTAYSPSVSKILTEYGQPDEIWIETMGFMREDLPVRLNMVYFQEGMAAGYVVDGDIQDGRVRGCFADKEIGRLRLVVPNSATSYRDFSTIFEKDRHYLPLEQATGLTMDEFIERFSDPTWPQCIETPTELWE